MKWFESFQKERPVYGTMGGEPTLPAIKPSDTLDAAEYINGPVEAPPRPRYEGPLFSVVEMADGRGGSAFGIRRNDGLGRWHPTRYLHLEEAESWKDWLVLEWLEGRETVLIEGFRCTKLEE
jgi:hypothetical protein